MIKSEACKQREHNFCRRSMCECGCHIDGLEGIE